LDSTGNWKLRRAKKERTWEEKGLGKILLPLDDALDLLFERISISKEQMKGENISLWEAGGRVLNCDITVEEDVPPFDRSPLDGYALRSTDTFEAQPEKPCSLKVLEEVPAGHIAEGKVKQFTAIKVLTGAPIPEGADAVIRYEEVKKENDNILLSRPVKAGEGVAPKGEDFSLGECVLKKGTVLGSAQLSVLASLGIDPVPVNPVPKIGVFCTGDELVDVKSKLNPGKIRVTNLYSVAQLISNAGGKPVNLGIVPDNLDAIKDVYKKAEAMDLDLVISTGGVSVGDYDVVKDAMLASGFENLFWKIAIRPGAPVAVSEKNSKLWIGLSGNPAGAIIVSLLLVVPVVAALAGKKRVWKRQKGELEVDIYRNKKGKGLGGFWWAQIYNDNGKYMVRPFKDQHCGVMKSYLSSNCLLKIPAGKVDWPAGTEVEVWMLP
jgi:molybdopterin molybdotransferase